MSISDRLQYMPVTLFTMVMGFAGLTLAWEKAGENWPLGLLVSRGLLALTTVLFAVLLTTREAVSMLRLAQTCNASQSAVKQGLERLAEDLAAGGFPVVVQRTGDSAQLLTAPEMYPYLGRLKKAKRADRLSAAALETLAVVAYRQPVMRAEIEAIRGVKVGPLLRTLLEHKLVDVVGRADVPGRPVDGPAPGGRRQLERRGRVRCLAVRQNGGKLPAADRGRVGICGARRHNGAVSVWQR